MPSLETRIDELSAIEAFSPPLPGEPADGPGQL